MSMIICNECGKEVSDKAQSCPNCGNPINMVPIQPQSQKFAKKQSFLGICAFIFSISFFLSIIGFLLGILDLYKNDKSKKHSCSILSIIISLFWFVLLCSLGTPIEHDEEEPTTAIQETIVAEDNTTIPSTNVSPQEEIIIPETTTVNTELTEDEYKAQCKEFYNENFFRETPSNNIHIKFYGFTNDKYTYRPSDVRAMVIEDITNSYNLENKYIGCSVMNESTKNDTIPSYFGESVYIMFEKDGKFNFEEMKSGKYITVYGEIIQNDNGIYILPKYIEDTK